MTSAQQAPAEKTFRSSLLQLKQAQKSPKGAPIYSLLINRPLGRIFAAGAHQLGMTPNQVTMVSAMGTFTGIIVIALATPGAAVGIVVAILLVLGYALDSSDGQLARLRGGGSPLGEWLDHVIDSFKIATLHLAVLLMFFRWLPAGSWWLLVPLLFEAVSVIHFFGMLLTDLLERQHRPPGTKAPQQGNLLMSAAKLPTDYGLLCLGFVLLTWPTVFLYFYAFLAIATTGYTALVLRRWAGRMSALGEPSGA